MHASTVHASTQSRKELSTSCTDIKLTLCVVYAHSSIYRRLRNFRRYIFFVDNLFRRKLSTQNVLCNVHRPIPILVTKVWLRNFWLRNLDYAKNLQVKYFTSENIYSICISLASSSCIYLASH